MSNKIRISTLFFLILIAVLFFRVLSHINLFNYSLSVILPIVLIPLGFFYLILNKKIKIEINIRKEILYFILIIMFLVLIPILQNIFFENMLDDNNRYSYNYIWVISLLGLSWLFSGAVFGLIYSNSFIKKINLVFFCIFSAIIFYAMNGSFFVDYDFLNMLRNDDIKMHHLSLTEPLMLVFFLNIAYFYDTKLKWIFIALTLYLMLALGGRVAFFGFIFSIVFYEFLISNKLTYFVKLILSSSLFISSLFLLSSNLGDNFAFNKLFFDEGFEKDESFQGRIQFLKDFMEGFFEQILIGNPNFFILKHGDLGTYVHNILSVLQFYGFLPFLFTIYLLFYIVRNIISLKIYKNNDVLIVFGIIFLIYTIFSVLVGKSLLFSSLWFILGFWLFKLKQIRDTNYVY